jgi:hypothetical protein
MASKIYFFIFILCSSIIVLGFSLQSYVNNNNYHEYLTNMSYQHRYINYTWYEESVKQDESNLSYQPILKNIIYFSIIFIILSSLLIYIYKDELPKNLKAKENTLIDDESRGEVSSGGQE